MGKTHPLALKCSWLLLQFCNYALTITSTPNSHWSASSDYPYSYNIDCCCCWLLLYNSANLRSPADPLHSYVILHEWPVFFIVHSWISTEVVFHLSFIMATPLPGTNQSQRTNRTSFLRAKCMGSSYTRSMLLKVNYTSEWLTEGTGLSRHPNLNGEQNGSCKLAWKQKMCKYFICMLHSVALATLSPTKEVLSLFRPVLLKV